MEFSAQLRTARITAGLTQRQVADAMGITNSTYCGYETGKREPDVAKIKQLSKILKVPADELLDTGINAQKHQRLSGGALQLARNYDELDAYGQRMVRMVADEEKARCTAQAHSGSLEEQRETVYTLPGFYQRMSAGTGQPADDDAWEDVFLTKRPPRGTSYVATIRGNSMEPTYRDGDRLFIRATVDIQPGQVGVFFMDGQQWVKELGDGVLLSHNPAYPPRLMTEDVRCQGLVLGVCDDSYFE